MSKFYSKERYGTVPNDVLNNPDVSLKAKGLFAFIQSKPDGWKFSVERIALQTKDGIESIRTAMKELEEAGYLKRTPLKNEEGKWDGYNYVLSANPTLIIEEIPSSENLTTDLLLTDNYPTLSNKEYSKKEKVNNIKTDMSTTVDDCLPIIEKWNAFASQNNLSQVRDLTPTRKKKLLARLKNKKFDIDKILEMASKSDFLMGRSPRGWKLNFDFLIRNDDNFIKILEGGYGISKPKGYSYEEVLKITGGKIAGKFQKAQDGLWYAIKRTETGSGGTNSSRPILPIGLDKESGL
jgi:hypothetical protein